MAFAAFEACFAFKLILKNVTMVSNIKMVIVVFFSAILILTEGSSVDLRVVYVSRAQGQAKTASCGTKSTPCKTLELGFKRLAWNGKIYVDGKNTDKDPYTCELRNRSSKKELKIQKSFTLLSYTSSTPRISCSNGIVVEIPAKKRLTNKVRVKLSNITFVDSKRLWVKNGINLTLDRVSFNNTKLQLTDTTRTTLQNCSFQKSYPAISAWISNGLPSFYLNVKSTIFKENCGCIEMNQPKKARGCNRKIVLNLQDILFQRNKILETKIPKDKESGLVSIRGSNNCNCKSMSFEAKWKNITVIDTQGEVKLCGKTRGAKNEKDCCWKWKEPPNEFARSIFAVHACKAQLRFSKVKSLNNINMRFLMSRSRINNIRVEDSSFYGHRIDNPGGIIYVKSHGESVNLTVKDSSFFNNSGTLGGVLHIDGGETKQVRLNMDNASLVHSYGSDSGCVVSVARVNYDHKSSSTHVDTIVANFRRILVKNTRFPYNQTKKDRHKQRHYAAFCFVASNQLKVSIKKSLFYRNDIAAFILKHKHIPYEHIASAEVKFEIKKTDFIENNSRRNATLTLMADQPLIKSRLTLSRTTFKKNNGTAVLANQVVDVRARNVTCTRNSGVCLFINSIYPPNMNFSVNSALKIEDSVFTHNLNSPVKFLHSKPRFLDIRILNSSFHKNHYRAALYIDIGFRKRNNTLVSGKLKIIRTNFTSNSVDFAQTHVLRFILMVPPEAKFLVSICKTVFKDNVQHFKGNLRGVPTSLFFFYVPEDIEIPKHKRCRKFPAFNYTRRRITFREVVFENNTGSSSMLLINNGFNSFRQCTFKNSFAKYPKSGAHVFIEEGTARVLFDRTKFEQTKISNCKPCSSCSDSPRCNHSSVLPFINAGTRGPLLIRKSNFTLHASERKSKIFIIQNGRYVHFDSKTKLRCPIGSYIKLENASHVIRPMFTRDHCRLNITRMRFLCQMCPIGTYSLQRGSIRGLYNKTRISCLDCPFGGNCAWNIKSKNNFWGYLSSSDPTPRLRFASCPERYCRMLRRSPNTSVYNRCVGNRTGMMCGACKKGFTESLFNRDCRPVNKCRDSWFWAIAVLYSAILGVYIFLQPPIVMYLVKKIMWFGHKTPSMPHRTHEQTETADSHGGRGYSKIIFYFYQVADLLMLESSFQILHEEVFVVNVLVSFYNFQVDVADSSFGCPFPGLTAVTKELFRSLQVFAVMVFLVVLYILHSLVWLIRGRPRPYFAPYLAAIVEVLLLGYERLAYTSFYLLNCTPLNIDDQEVWKMFIDGNITCWVHWWQYAMIAYNIVFVIPFMLVLLVGTSKLQRRQIGPFQFLAACFVPLPFLVYWMLKRIKVARLSDGTGTREARDQQYTKHFLEVIQGPFRRPKDKSKGALYWESILIGRRLVLLGIHSLVATPMLRILSMTFVCLLILLHEVMTMPFKDRKANVMAVFLLCIHVVLGAINLVKASLINAGVSPKGPPEEQMHALQLLEIALLSILPCAFVLLVATCLMSQAIRLIFKAGLYLYSKICSQDKNSRWYPRQGRKCLGESHEPLLNPEKN